MKSKTYSERLVAGLLNLGWVEDKQDKSRYRAFVKHGSQSKAFVGPQGALRMGECASKSLSIGTPTNQSLSYLVVLKAGEHQISILPMGLGAGKTIYQDNNI